ncbi:membrane protein [Flavobacterium lutivivi]|nr:membrane protein [Flavobacterium lutivivi]
MENRITITGLFFGVTSIILGAFGAHALKNYLTPEQLISFETGVRYQMYHALFLLFLAKNESINLKTKKSVYYLISIGVVLFSFSIFLLTTKNVTSIDFKFLGPITPIGGLLLISGWMILLINFFKRKE